MAEICICLMRTKSYITQNELWTSSDACGCVRQWSHCFSSISPIGLCFWVFKMFFYDSYLILDHNQVHSSWIFIEHLTISVSNSAPVCFSSFHCTQTYCLRFFMTHCLVQILIWIFPHLANIQTKKKQKNNHSKMLSTKKKWKISEVEANFHVFWRSGLGNFMFYYCFVRFVVLLSALCYSNLFLDCVLYIGLSLPSIEVEFIPSIWHKIAMSTVDVF